MQEVNHRETIEGGGMQEGEGNIQELSVELIFFCKPKTSLINKFYKLKKKHLGEVCLKDTNLLPSVALSLGKSRKIKNG